MTQAQFSEQQFMKWVRFVGRLKHSVFKTAKNKLFPSYTLHVTKNRAAGDFRTIQDAIDSLPFINLLRVVIKVHAGVYTSGSRWRWVGAERRKCGDSNGTGAAQLGGVVAMVDE
ncbi:hypothetical protein L3X38_036131 [Prunus dulcis]|uniref:Uncharacterized protein n=1 Tax=Prunus dulcis TaxID=3755 RepID=A0AAD4V0V7_PRUDU|nr:hypothetical protein L3X38_036131 [Prunus dulcis]